MSKVTISVGFYLEDQHYAQMEAYLPRTEAIKIPQLKIKQQILSSSAKQILNQPKSRKGPVARGNKNEPFNKSQKSQSKKVDSEEIQEQDIQIEGENEDDDANEQFEEQQLQMPEGQEEQIVEEDPINSERIDSQKQEQNLMHYLEQDDDSQDSDIEDSQISSLSKSMSIMRNNQRTKRQKGDRQGLMELPDRRPRKDKKVDEATQIIRREQKQRKRKQYLKKQVEAQQKATLDKILNEAGRKLKLKEQKQKEDEKRHDDRQIKHQSNIPKIITIDNHQGHFIMLHNTGLFPKSMTQHPEIKIKAQCSLCGACEGRYKIKNTSKTACSLDCYKVLVA